MRSWLLAVACVAGCGGIERRGGGAANVAPPTEPAPTPAPEGERPSTPVAPTGDAGAGPPAIVVPLQGRVGSVAFDLRVHPPGAAEVAGFVFDRDGQVVARACVELVAGGGKTPADPVFSSAEGAYRFAAVPAGPARIHHHGRDHGVAGHPTHRRLPHPGSQPDGAAAAAGPVAAGGAPGGALDQAPGRFSRVRARAPSGSSRPRSRCGRRATRPPAAGPCSRPRPGRGAGPADGTRARRRRPPAATGSSGPRGLSSGRGGGSSQASAAAGRTGVPSRQMEVTGHEIEGCRVAARLAVCFADG